MVCCFLIALGAILCDALPAAALSPIGTSGFEITTAAGNGTAGFLGDSSAATSAELDNPYGVAIDAHGNIIIADYLNNRIRVLAEATGTFYQQPMVAGDIYTIAGNGTAGFQGDGAAATAAELNNPRGVYVDASGDILVGDYLNNRVRVIAESTGSHYGQAMTAGDIYTIAGNGTGGFSGDGGAATAAELVNPVGLAIDPNGNVVIADVGNNRIRVIAESSGTFYQQAMTAGDIYTVAGDATQGYTGTGGPATSAELYWPHDVHVDSSGNLVIADTYNNVIRVVAESTGTYYGQSMTVGDIYTIAGNGTAGFLGDGGAATSAEFDTIYSIAFDAEGNILLTDATNNRIRVLAESTGMMYGMPMTAGDVYTIAGDGTAGFAGDGGAPVSAELNLPTGLVTNSAGDVFIADIYNNRIRELLPTESLQASAAIGAGTLSFVSAPGNVTFTTATLTGTDQTATASETLDIGDNTGSGSGWNVTLSNSAFTSGTHTLPSADFTAATPGVPSCDSGVSCSAATWSANVAYPYALPGATATKLLSASATTGRGDQTVIIAWSEKIPAAAYTGTYSSTWTLTLVSGP